MGTPLISVYITNYNYEAYIRQSIESVLSQSTQNFELLIIDDGSKDKSKEIIEEYRDHPKVSIIYQQNKGLNITNNVAMRVANGKYLMRLDADDYLDPTALELMAEVLEADDALGLVFPDYYYVDKDGNLTGEERRHNFEKEVSLYDQPAHGACTMIRLAFLKNLGGYNESFTCQDGYDLWIKFVTHYKVANINKPLFSYRRHGSNLTTNEGRILDTRKKIKEAFVDQYLQTPETLAIIPIRNTFIGDINWPLYKVDDQSIIQHKVAACLRSRRIGHVIVSTSDYEILAHCREIFGNDDKVSIIERPKEFTRLNETLNDTIKHALDYHHANFKMVDAIMTLSVEYPFLLHDVIDEAVNTLALFKSDSVLSVIPDNRMYYQHTGHTLHPILDQEKFTKLEREAIYRGAGGVVLSTVKNFMDNHKMTSSKISHVVVDQKTAMRVSNLFEFEVFKKFSN
jgi:glycosyltransferase involved in cell wall biosynthesis